MFPRTLWTVVLGIALALAPSVVFAADGRQKDMTVSQDTSASAPASPAPAAGTEMTPAVPAPAALPPAPPVLKPIVITFSGDLAAVSAAGTPPMITVQDRYGVRKEIVVPSEAKITAGGTAKALGDLKVGDKLTVEYTYDVATGKRAAQSIAIGSAGAPSSAAATPAR